MRAEALGEIQESFSEVPRFYVELQQQELRTLEVLKRVGDRLFGDWDPDAVLFQRRIYEIDRERKILRIYLPFADKGELKLEQGDRELLVGVRNETRRFPVPAEFAEREIAGAKFEEGYLHIRF